VRPTITTTIADGDERYILGPHHRVRNWPKAGTIEGVYTVRRAGVTATINLGYPRIGARRDLKRALEAYWKGAVDEAHLQHVASSIRLANWRSQREAGIDLIPSNDFSLYDHVLDTIALVGAVPPRFAWDGSTVGLDLYFAMARGGQTDGRNIPALDLTKWFDTNYHYLTPEFQRGQQFRGAGTKPLEEFDEAQALGIATRPVLLGLVSFLLLGTARDEDGDFDPLAELFDPLLAVYQEVIGTLAARGADGRSAGRDGSPRFAADAEPCRSGAGGAARLD
jgi:5-methyltetrahydropteroyltriglutamate--homocysteine methyltransferase